MGVDAKIVEESERPFPIKPSRSQMCTEQGFKFARTHEQIFEFLFFSLNLAIKADETRLVAARALAQIDEDHKNRLVAIEAEKDHTVKAFGKFGRLMYENMCIRIVDNFICFLSDTIQVCMNKRPELLRSSEKVGIDEVLRFSNFKDLTAFLVDRKINEISYGGIKEIEPFFLDRTGINLFSSEGDRTKALISIELRNIYTHNRGVINDIFVKRTHKLSHGYKFVRGKRFAVHFDDVVDFANCMYSNAIRLDALVAKKFRVRRKLYKTWLEGRRVV